MHRSLRVATLLIASVVVASAVRSEGRPQDPTGTWRVALDTQTWMVDWGGALNPTSHVAMREVLTLADDGSVSGTRWLVRPDSESYEMLRQTITGTWSADGDGMGEMSLESDPMPDWRIQAFSRLSPFQGRWWPGESRRFSLSARGDTMRMATVLRIGTSQPPGGGDLTIFSPTSLSLSGGAARESGPDARLDVVQPALAPVREEIIGSWSFGYQSDGAWHNGLEINLDVVGQLTIERDGTLHGRRSLLRATNWMPRQAVHDIEGTWEAAADGCILATVQVSGDADRAAWQQPTMYYHDPHDLVSMLPSEKWLICPDGQGGLVLCGEFPMLIHDQAAERGQGGPGGPWPVERVIDGFITGDAERGGPPADAPNVLDMDARRRPAGNRSPSN